MNIQQGPNGELRAALVKYEVPTAQNLLAASDALSKGKDYRGSDPELNGKLHQTQLLGATATEGLLDILYRSAKSELPGITEATKVRSIVMLHELNFAFGQREAQLAYHTDRWVNGRQGPFTL